MSEPFEDGEREPQDGAGEGAEEGGAVVACPGCGAEVPDDTVVCFRCGWNFASGKRTEGVEEASRRKRKRAAVAKWVLWGAVAVSATLAAMAGGSSCCLSCSEAGAITSAAGSAAA